MFQSSQHHATLGGRKDSSWDGKFTVRKAPVFHGRAFDNRLFRDTERRDTEQIVQRLLESEDALDPQGPSHVFLRHFLRGADYTALTTSNAPPGLLPRNLAIFDDRRERDNFQDALRDWGDPIYQNGPRGVDVSFGAVDEKRLYERLKQKVCLCLWRHEGCGADPHSDKITARKGVYCKLLRCIATVAKTIAPDSLQILPIYASSH